MESGLKRDNYGLTVFLGPKKLCNVTENPLEGTLDISKTEYFFHIENQNIFSMHKKRFHKLFSFPILPTQLR